MLLWEESLLTTGEATATIRAEAADGSGKYAEHIVYVMGKSDQIEITEFNGSLNSKKSSEIDIQKISRDHKVSFVAQLSGGSSQQGNYDKEVDHVTATPPSVESCIFFPFATCLGPVIVTSGSVSVTVNVYDQIEITEFNGSYTNSKKSSEIDIQRINTFATCLGPVIVTSGSVSVTVNV